MHIKFLLIHIQQLTEFPSYWDILEQDQYKSIGCCWPKFQWKRNFIINYLTLYLEYSKTGERSEGVMVKYRQLVVAQISEI